MFIGHYGVALGLKKAHGSISLGLLFIAVQLNDLIWPVLILLGIEKVAIVPGITRANPMDFVYYPFSHSLGASLLWALLTAGIALILPLPAKLNKRRLAVVLGVAVLSHYLLDLVVHRPDLPLLGGDSYKLGLGLWNHVAVSYTLETAIFLAGLWIYLKATAGRDKVGKYGVPLFAFVLVIFNLINLFAVPPDNSKMIASSTLIVLPLLALVAFWLDRHRAPAQKP